MMDEICSIWPGQYPANDSEESLSTYIFVNRYVSRQIPYFAVDAECGEGAGKLNSSVIAVVEAVSQSAACLLPPNRRRAVTSHCLPGNTVLIIARLEISVDAGEVSR